MTIFIEVPLIFQKRKYKLFNLLMNTPKCLRSVRFQKMDDSNLIVEATMGRAFASKHSLRGIFYF